MYCSEVLIVPVVVFEPQIHRDDRGSFQESYNREKYAKAIGDVDLVQVNTIHSHYGVARGLHFNVTGRQGKLVQSVLGRHWSVAVDVRKDSSTVGMFHGEFLSEENGKQLWVPPGFAHGIVCLSDRGVAQYLSNVGHEPENEVSLRLNLPWPIDPKALHFSMKDLRGQTLDSFLGSQ